MDKSSWVNWWCTIELKSKPRCSLDTLTIRPLPRCADNSTTLVLCDSVRAANANQLTSTTESLNWMISWLFDVVRRGREHRHPISITTRLPPPSRQISPRKHMWIRLSPSCICPPILLELPSLRRPNVRKRSRKPKRRSSRRRLQRPL